MLWLNQLAAGASMVDDAGRRMGEMRRRFAGDPSAVFASGRAFVAGEVRSRRRYARTGDHGEMGASLRNFQILRTNQMYDNRSTSARLAVDFYKSLLADPTPADWQRNPLDAMAVLQTGQDPAFERWFVAALERKDAALRSKSPSERKGGSFWRRNPSVAGCWRCGRSWKRRWQSFRKRRCSSGSGFWRRFPTIKQCSMRGIKHMINWSQDLCLPARRQSRNR